MAHNRTNGRDREWNREDALTAGRRWVEVYGEPPTRGELNPSQMRRQLTVNEQRLQDLRSRVDRFDPSWMPGAHTIRRLFGGMDGYLAALGFTPRGTGRPRRSMAAHHAREVAEVLRDLTAGHRQVLDVLAGLVSMSEGEARFQRAKHAPELGPVDQDLGELVAAGLVAEEVRVTYRLTPEGRARLQAENNAKLATPQPTPQRGMDSST